MEAILGVVIGAAVSTVVTIINDRLRWRREDQIRRQDAQRDDAIHWREARERVYADYIRSSREFARPARRLLDAVENQRTFEIDIIEELTGAFHAIAAAADDVDLYGSEESRSAAEAVPARAWEFLMAALQHEALDGEEKVDNVVTLRQRLREVTDRHDRVLSAARHNLGLGVEPPAPVNAAARSDQAAS